MTSFIERTETAVDLDLRTGKARSSREPSSPPTAWCRECSQHIERLVAAARRTSQSDVNPPDEQLLPRIHRAISNLKSWLRRGHLRVYVDEYVFRFNRRGTPIAAFQTLLGLGSQHDPEIYRQILARPESNRISTSRVTARRFERGRRVL